MIEQPKTRAVHIDKELDCVSYSCPSFKEARGIALPDRTADVITHICWHTTGVGVRKRAGKTLKLIIDGEMKRVDEASVTEAALYVYQNIMQDYAAHFVIGLDGEIVQTTRLLKKAQHVGTPKSWSKIYLHAPQWWAYMRSTLEHPLPKDGTSFNMMSIGIEFVSPARNGVFTDKQTIAAAILRNELTIKLGKRLLFQVCHSLVRPDPYMINGKKTGGRTLEKSGKPIDLTLAQQDQLKVYGLL